MFGFFFLEEHKYTRVRRLGTFGARKRPLDSGRALILGVIFLN
jgi:hypothetical protein